MGIPRPGFHLHTGSGSHGSQTAAMLRALEELFMDEKPDAVLVYGDTNSTLAGALAASKMGIAVIHVEAGLRSFNKAMPEEINRILTDHVSSLLFAPTGTGVENLLREGFALRPAGEGRANHPAVIRTGDVMYDNALHYRGRAAEKTREWFAGLGLSEGSFCLATIHRNANTDDPLRLRAILQGIGRAAALTGGPVVLPLHPRTRKMMAHFAETDSFFENLPPSIRLIPPASYLQMVRLESACSMVLTDSGGVQKEAYFYGKPCVVLRPETEWLELLEAGAARLADADPALIENAVREFRDSPREVPAGLYGDGHSAARIAAALLDFFRS
jgi:UDP-GlcNAc3NAcA epimerase